MKLKYEIAVVAMAVILIAAPLLFWRRAPRFIKEFFGAASAPINLAIFRIVLFTTVLCSFSVTNVRWFGGLPAELQFPPTGLHSILEYLPISESIARLAAIALIIFCLASIAGVFTRVATVACLVLSLYVLGLPQFFGKINHYHHLIWFMAILAASPCADMLSVDAVIKSWKRADRGIRDPPEPSQAYALPLRFTWLLMGVIYFSAGVWKVWTAGYKWAWSDNPRNLMYNKWMELSGWTPVFRIDHYPLLYKLSGVFTICFELSFIFLIFFPAVRFLAPAGGLFFHNMTNLFMRISFWELQVCYVVFVDWKRFFSYVGRKLFKEEMYIVYDGNCCLCRRTVASFRVFDILGRVIYVNALDEEALQRYDLLWLDSNALMRDMHAVVGRKTWAGFPSYRIWLRRLPLFWPAQPLLYLWPMNRQGERVYRHIADSRACTIDDPASRIERQRISNRRSKVIITMVGSLLVYAAILSAIAKFQSWPMAGYPTFEDLDKPEVSVLTMAIQGQAGEIAEITPAKQQQTLTELSPERLAGLMNHLLAITDENERRMRLRAFWKVWIRENPSSQGAVMVRFYRDTLSSLPEARGNLMQRDFVYEFRP